VQTLLFTSWEVYFGKNSAKGYGCRNGAVTEDRGHRRVLMYYSFFLEG